MTPADPMKHAPDPQRELFDQFAALARGFPIEAVIGAALNIVANAASQAHATRAPALASYDEKVARVRAALAERYDLTGKRRNVFPFPQVIEVPHLELRTRR